MTAWMGWPEIFHDNGHRYIQECPECHEIHLTQGQNEFWCEEHRS